jgi:hypothetical protein
VPEEGRYRLAPVRDARERAERSQRVELAVAVGDARTADDRLGAVQARVQAARRALADAIAARDTLHLAALRALADRFVARRRRELEHAIVDELRIEAAREAQHDEVELARRGFARARADRHVIEQHFVRWRQDQRKLAERRED